MKYFYRIKHYIKESRLLCLLCGHTWIPHTEYIRKCKRGDRFETNYKTQGKWYQWIPDDVSLYTYKPVKNRWK